MNFALPFSEESETFSDSWELSELTEDQGSLELGLRKWKGQAHAALELGLEEIKSTILKVSHFLHWLNC